MREAVGNRRPELLPLVEQICAGEVITGDEANQVRDAVGDELAATGVDADSGAVNERGEKLDDLIDAVARASTLDSE